jgi:1,4-dihydroxy-2-naphthoyl-CoA synthase
MRGRLLSRAEGEYGPRGRVGIAGGPGCSRSPTSMPSPALNRVAAPEALDDEVEALVARIVAKPRVAIALGKALFYRQLEQGIVSAYEDAGATMAYNMMDLSALEGVQAFIEKRMPNWVAGQA